MSKRIGFLVVLVGLLAACGARGGGEDGAPYYALTLTNGSLFFAHLKYEDDRYLYLNDVHYFQRTPPPPAKKGEQPASPGLTLVKQSADPQGPKDELILNRDQLLFYQELRNDSRVVQLIRQPAQPPQAVAPMPPPPPR